MFIARGQNNQLSDKSKYLIAIQANERTKKNIKKWRGSEGGKSHKSLCVVLDYERKKVGKFLFKKRSLGKSIEILCSLLEKFEGYAIGE